MLSIKISNKDTSYINIDPWEEFFFARKELVIGKRYLKKK